MHLHVNDVLDKRFHHVLGSYDVGRMSNGARKLSRCYLRSYLLKKYCRSSQRAQQETQEQSSNTEEQATCNSEVNTSIA